MAEQAELVMEADVVADDLPTNTSPGSPVTPGVALAPRPTATVAPQVEARELGARLDVIRQAMAEQMTPAVDYGVIPGTNKPTLLKPGAEKLSVLFQLDVQLVNEKEWGPDDHLTVTSHATVFHAPTGQRLGYGEGMCSTREKKYAKRRGERVCPECGKPAIIKGKQEFGGGWLCFKRKDGCGAKFKDGDEAIESQVVGDVENPDLPDAYNTVLKMAEKRARVDAVLAVTGASALFTQDVEDQQVPDNEKSAQADVPEYGVASGGQSTAAASRALVKLCGGDEGRAKKAWGEIVTHFGGYMPAAAALTIRKVASAGVASIAPIVVSGSDIPWDSTYVPPQEAREVEQLENEALSAWQVLEGAEKAAKRVAAAAGNVEKLRRLIGAATEAAKKVAEGGDQA